MNRTNSKHTSGLHGGSVGSRIFIVINITILTMLAVMCAFPVVHMFSVSLSNQSAVAANQVNLLPVGFNLASYKMVAKREAFWNSFGVSVQRVAIGVTINTVLTVLMAYPLSKSVREFPSRRVYVWILLFAMIFDGGLIPNYLQVKNLDLFDTIWALVLPGAVPIYNVILVMNFMKQLPDTIEEAAEVDGASYFQRFTRIVLPLSKPSIATVVLFSFLNHWNGWFDGKIYNNNTANYPLQTYLQALLANTDLTNSSEAIENALTNVKTLQAAQLFLTMLPILIVYPFLQKYFTKGLTIGAVKG
ncbi:MAG: carbohydrate ABC transporter permease [Lachnospiraceae bacterium]|nr:carbohydrate ABC transporter permease [Lachnospiraceae bacterium]